MNALYSIKKSLHLYAIILTVGKSSQTLLESEHAGQQSSIREEQETAFVSTLHPS